MELSIKEQLMADMKTAMKAKEEGRLALGVIRMARAHIRQAEIDDEIAYATISPFCATASIDDGHADFDDDQVLAVLRKEVKQRKETLAEIKDSGRDDLVEETQKEIAVLEKYLPPEMTEDAIRAVVIDVISALDPERKNLGTAMKAVMAKLKGKADGKVVNRLVRDVLG